jgi:hypothetical protein
MSLESDIIDTWISARYRNDEKTKAWIATIGIQLSAMRDTCHAMTYNINDAKREQLDFIGHLVGIDRLSIGAREEFFGWKGQPLANGFDITPWYDQYSGSIEPISDSTYRRAILLKIMKNVSGCTTDECIYAAQSLLEQPIELVEDFENRTLSFIYENDLSIETLEIISLYDLKVIPSTTNFLGYQQRGFEKWLK